MFSFDVMDSFQFWLAMLFLPCVMSVFHIGGTKLSGLQSPVRSLQHPMFVISVVLGKK
jgi:hypothetical protein